MAGNIDPSHPVVREALKQHAVGIALDALGPVLDSAVARGLSRDHAAEIAHRAIYAGDSDGVLDRVAAALDEAVHERGDL